MKRNASPGRRILPGACQPIFKVAKSLRKRIFCAKFLISWFCGLPFRIRTTNMAGAFPNIWYHICEKELMTGKTWVFFILEPVRLLGTCKPGSRACMDSTTGIASYYFHLYFITLCYWAGPLGKLYLIDLLSFEDEKNWFTLLGSRVNHEKGKRFQIVSCSFFEHIWLNVKIPQVGYLKHETSFKFVSVPQALCGGMYSLEMIKKI